MEFNSKFYGFERLLGCGLLVLVIIYRVKPSVDVGLGIGGYCKMGEPGIGGCTMPMDDVGGYFYHVACHELTGWLAFFLIISASTYADEELSAGVAVPIVAAARLEGDVGNGTVQIGVRCERRKIGLPDEEL